MIVEKLYALLSDLAEELGQRNIVKLLQDVQNNLQKSISEPQQPTHGENFRKSLTSLYEALDGCPSNQLVPSRYELFVKIGGAAKTGIGLRQRIESILTEYSVIPPTALAEIQKVHAEVQEFSQVATTINQSLSKLEIHKDQLADDEFEVGLVIPKEDKNPDVTSLNKDLKHFDKLSQVISEIAKEERISPVVRSLGTGSIEIFLLIKVGTVALLWLKVIEKLLDVFRKVIELDNTINEMKEKQFPKDVIKGAEDHLERERSSGLERVTVELIDDNYKGDPERKNELRNELSFELKILARRIAEGVKVEVSVPKSQDVTDETGEAKPKMIPGTTVTYAQLAKQGTVMRDFERSGKLFMLGQEAEEDELEEVEEDENEK